jgi:hypothetical protein
MHLFNHRRILHLAVFFCFWLLLPFAQLPGELFAQTTDPQLKVEIGADNSYAILENSQIRVEYRAFTAGFQQFAIKKFIVKSAGNQDQVGDGANFYLDTDSGRGALESASIVYDGTDRKTLRFTWKNKTNATRKLTYDVSIYPNGRFLKMDYTNIQYGLSFVDLGRPGGTAAGTHLAYGGDKWGRDYITHQDPNFKGSYYNRYPADGVNDPTDGGALNYHNHFIFGVYDATSGAGFARVLPVAHTAILKLLLEPKARRGLEIYPHPFYQAHTPFTGYLYAVTGGAAEILAAGKSLADANYVEPPPPTTYKLTASVTGGNGTISPTSGTYNAGTTVPLTAEPTSGYQVLSWTGTNNDSSTSNTNAVTMNSDKNVTVEFEQIPPDQYTLVVNVQGSGSVSVNPQKASYASGDKVTLTATPGTNWQFDSWSGDLAGASIDGNKVDLTMDGNRTITAVFTEKAANIVLYGEDFQGYSAGANPSGWVDTGANNSLSENDSLFKVFDQSGNRVFGTTSTLANIHSHLRTPSIGTVNWYQYSGRMRITNAAGGIGVTFFSQYPDQDAYYRLRRYADGTGSFHLNNHGTTVAGTTDTAVVPVANAWYNFKIQVQDTGTRTEILAKVWQNGKAEPAGWQINAYDDSATRLQGGTIGLWSFGTGSKHWDDLQVTDLNNPEDPPDPVELFASNFNGETIGANPGGWTVSGEDANDRVDIVDSAGLSLEGDRAVAIKRVDGSVQMLAKFPNGPFTMPVSMEFMVRRSEANKNVLMQIYGLNGGQWKPYVAILQNAQGRIQNNAGAGMKNLGSLTYSANRTYQYRIDLNPGSNTYDLFIDGVLVGDDVPTMSTQPNVFAMQFVASSNGANVYIDNFKLFDVSK